MPSSIFNSKDRIPPIAYGRMACVAVFFLFALGLSSEFALRGLGYRASVVDDFDLWALQRMQCDADDTASDIVLIGSSRAAADIDPSLLAEAAGYARTSNLSVSATACFSTLYDIAENTNFNGLVICTLNASQFRTDADQEPWVSYYHRNYKNLGRIEREFNRRIKTYLQQHIVLLNPPLRALFRSVQYRQLCPRGRIGTDDRQTLLQYDRLPAQYMQRVRSNRVQQQYQKLEDPPPNLEHWKQQLQAFSDQAQKIRKRGGRVLIVRLPTTGDYFRIDQQLYPRDEFWSLVEEDENLDTVHFQDVPAMRQLECPETSHLAEGSVVACTMALAEEIKRLYHR